MVNNAQEDINKLINKDKINYLDLSNRDLEGEMNLEKFTNLKSINASNNRFESLENLFTLPNKKKLEKISFWGNRIKEVDLSLLLKEFPNLKWLNLENNPLSAKNLSNLSKEQFNKLVEGIKDKKIKINSWKGTILMDLLEYTQQLINKGENTQQVHELQKLIQINNPVKEKKQTNNFNYVPLIIMGFIIAVVGSILTGYLWGKRKKRIKIYNIDE